jgi:hypothetical protein
LIVIEKGFKKIFKYLVLSNHNTKIN